MSKFPSCFPDDFEINILPEGVHYKEISVYRVMKKGVIDREGFLSTYEETIKGFRPSSKKRPLDLSDPSTYSTSCNVLLSDAQYVLNIFSRVCPAPIIAKGKIHPSCGPWQLTSERIVGANDSSHIDWWIYDDSNPQNYFSEVDEDET